MSVSDQFPRLAPAIPIISLLEGRQGGTLLLALADRHLGALLAWQLREVLLANIEAGERSILLDFAQVESIDASILATLIGTIRRLGPGGRLAITHASPAVRHILSRTGMDAILLMETGNDNVPPAQAA